MKSRLHSTRGINPEVALNAFSNNMLSFRNEFPLDNAPFISEQVSTTEN